ncbi:MAG TPA: HAD family hydrolase [Gaiellales bacterium]
MSRYDAVLLDAFGTLIDIDQPYLRLRRSLRRHLGAEVSAAAAERAFRAEMTYYADHCHEGADAFTLAELRTRCAAIVLEDLGIAADPAHAAPLLVDAIAFRVYTDVAPLLAGLDRAGVGVAVVSNWDCSLPETLAAAGVEIGLVFDSATTGSTKPDPGIFRRALRALGVEPERALHIGDTEETDGVGAREAGVDVRIVDRGAAAAGADTITSLTDVLALL